MEKLQGYSNLVNPANKRKLDVIVVGTGLAGASAAASLGELGFNVKIFCYQDSPRRAHSIAAQGGINAAKNYQNDGDSVYRLFYDTIKGATFVPAKQTFIVCLKLVAISLTNVWHKGYHLPGIWRPAGQSFIWRGPGFSHILCPWPNRAAIVVRGIQRPKPPN